MDAGDAFHRADMASRNLLPLRDALRRDAELGSKRFDASEFLDCDSDRLQFHPPMKATLS